MPSSISVFGLGYVGSVTAACLAHQGHRVLGVDLNPWKVEMLGSGRPPIPEKGLNELTEETHRTGRLKATSDTAAAIKETDISFICVGTPSQRTGKLDLRAVEHVSKEIGQALCKKNSVHWIILRSTVLPGTTESVVIPALEAASGKKAGTHFAVCFNPEFLREGTAVEDFFEPPCTVLGTRHTDHIGTLRELYAWAPSAVFETTPPSAELVKYLCNAFHALKVGFANEFGTLARELGVDTQIVTKIFTSDTRLNISAAYLKPGFAFGGSCLPKDLRALTYRAKELDLKLPLLESILPSNDAHIHRAADMILRTGKRKVGMVGLSFKSGTDDLRESPLVHLVKRLLGEGCQLQVWDESVSLGRLIGSNRQFIEDEIPHIGVLLTENLQDVVKNAEVVVLGANTKCNQELYSAIRPDHIVIDLVHLDKDRRPGGLKNYTGICW